MSNELAQPGHPLTRRSKLRRIGVLSMAMTQAAIMMAISLVVVAVWAVIGGAFLAFGAAAGASSSTGSGLSPAQMAGMGAGMLAVIVIFLPLVYGVMGFVLGAVAALAYNLVASWTGGIEMEFLDREDARPY